MYLKIIGVEHNYNLSHLNLNRNKGLPVAEILFVCELNDAATRVRSDEELVVVVLVVVVGTFRCDKVEES